MKQEITSKDWGELSESTKNIWRNWSYEHKHVQVDRDGAIMQMPTIGQMIEFLGDSWFEYLIYAYAPSDNYIKLEHNFDDIYYPRNNKLCDDLLEAVKEKIESE